MNVTDDILNKFIDGELNSIELDELNKKLSSDEELVKHLKALKLTHQLLRKMEETPAPESFTDRIMQKITPALSQKTKATSRMFFAVISFFSLLIFGILGYAISTIKPAEGTSTMTTDVMDKVNGFVSQNSPGFFKYLTSDSVLFIGGMLSFILLLGLYFMVHSHKTFRENLERFGS